MDNISFDNSFWTFLHVITFFYPDNPTMDDKKNYYLFLSNFKNFIPCQTCKAHYINHYNEHNNLNNELIQNTVSQLTAVESATEQESSIDPAAPAPASAEIYIHSNEMLNDDYINSLDYLQSKENLSRKMVDYHNTVNKLLNKPEYTYDEAKEYYEKMMENSEMLKKSTI